MQFSPSLAAAGRSIEVPQNRHIFFASESVAARLSSEAWIVDESWLAILGKIQPSHQQ